MAKRIIPKNRTEKKIRRVARKVAALASINPVDTVKAWIAESERRKLKTISFGDSAVEGAIHYEDNNPGFNLIAIWRRGEEDKKFRYIHSASLAMTRAMSGDEEVPRG